MLNTFITVITRTWLELSKADREAIQKRWGTILMPWDLKILNWTLVEGDWTPSERGL